MREIFHTILAGKGFSDDEIERLSNEFSAIVFLDVIAKVVKNLGAPENAKINELLQANRLSEALEVARQNRPAEEWKKLMAQCADKLLDDYVSKVIKTSV